MRLYLLTTLTALLPFLPTAQRVSPPLPSAVVDYAEALEKELRETLRGIGRELGRSTDVAAAMVRQRPFWGDDGFGASLTDEEVVGYIARFSELWHACWKYVHLHEHRERDSREEARERLMQSMPSDGCHFVASIITQEETDADDVWFEFDTREGFDAVLERLRVEGDSAIRPLLALPYWTDPLYRERASAAKMNGPLPVGQVRIRRVRRHGSERRRLFNHVPSLDDSEIYHVEPGPNIRFYIAHDDGGVRLIHVRLSIF